MDWGNISLSKLVRHCTPYPIPVPGVPARRRCEKRGEIESWDYKDLADTSTALHLANDDIEGCHSIAAAGEGVGLPYGVQECADASQTPTADMMHATLHRREGQLCVALRDRS